MSAERPGQREHGDGWIANGRTIASSSASRMDGNDLREGNPAFDDVALYYLVEGGIATYFARVPGRVQIDECGANSWMGGGSPESHLRLLPGVENELIEVITDRITGEF
jgi:hypothetical protein